MDKKLQEKLDKKTQETIEVCCGKCGADTIAVLVGRGSNVEDPHYEFCEKTKIITYTQNGQSHDGYPRHKCKTEG